MKYLDEIRVAIRRKHGCDSVFREIVRVREVIRGKTAWEGEVAVFGLLGHPTAKCCYAWGDPPEDSATEREIFMVIDIPPVDSAETAIRFALAAHARKTNAPNSASK